MASSYPGGVDAFATNKTNSTSTEDDHPGHHNDLADAVNKIEGELGVDPAGSEATVVARLNAADTTISGKLSSSAIPTWIRYLNGRIAGETAHADDDFFTDASYSGWTTVTVTGTQTITEAQDKLSVLTSGQSANDINGALKAMTTTSAPVTIETAVSVMGRVQNHNLFGLCFTDGTTSTSNAAAFDVNLNSGNGVAVRSGTLTNLATSADSSVLSVGGFGMRIYMRFTWKSANTFRANLSPDGVTYSDFGMADSAVTLTPTTFGLYWSVFGGSNPMQLSFDYFRVYAADLSV